MINSLSFLSQVSTVIWVVFAVLVAGQLCHKLITAVTKIYI